MWSSIPWANKVRAHKRIGRFLFGAGVWDSWGFGLSYCHYSKAFTIDIIHFYIYLEYWTRQEYEDFKERQNSLVE